MWTHVHCNHVKTTLKSCDVRTNADETCYTNVSVLHWLCSISPCQACRSLPAWNSGNSFFFFSLKESVHQSFRAKNKLNKILNTVHDHLLVTRARHRRLDWVKKSFAFGALWMFLSAMQVSGSPLNCHARNNLIRKRWERPKCQRLIFLQQERKQTSKR